MKKNYLIIIISFLFLNVVEIQAQELSLQETKNILNGHKWVLTAMEQDGIMYKVPEELQGLKRVFVNNGISYSYLPYQKENEIEQYKWSITKTHITFYLYDEPQVYRYSLEEFKGYTLFLDLEGEPDMPTLVFEQYEKVDPTQMLSKTMHYYIKDFFETNFVKSIVKEKGNEKKFDYRITAEGIFIYVQNISEPTNIFNSTYEWFYLAFNKINIYQYSTNLGYFENVNAIRFYQINGYIPHGPDNDYTNLAATTYGAGSLHIPFRYNTHDDLDTFKEVLTNANVTE